MIKLPQLPPSKNFETVGIFKNLTKASRALAELKGESKTIPNEEILINTLSLQEAKDSSAIENIITTQDDLYRADVDETFDNLAAKEVQSYSAALKNGFELVKKHKFLTNNYILEIQKILEPTKHGFRKVPGTVLQNSSGETIYTPPQDANEIVSLMNNLEKYINEDETHKIDSLLKMAIIHYQFESIHPFYDGNGRTGRIINILYLVAKNLLDIPVLYLSRYIVKNKSEYYNLLQAVRDKDDFENWIKWMLKGVEETAIETVELIRAIKVLMLKQKEIIRSKLPKIYSKDLLEAIFKHPYTKITFLEDALNIHRNTANSYLNQLSSEIGILEKVKLGKSNYYLNKDLYNLFKEGKI